MAIFGETSDIAAGFSLLSHVMLMFPVLFVDFLSAVVTVGSIWRVTAEENSEAGNQEK